MKRYALLLLLVLACSTTAWGYQVGMCYSSPQVTMCHWVSWNPCPSLWPSPCPGPWPTPSPCPTPNPLPTPTPCPTPNPCPSWFSCSPWGQSCQTTFCYGGGNSSSQSNSYSYSYSGQ